MRCSKCGYISFDYNQLCPKCNKDISDQQDKLNIPSFRPNPPFLLGTLIGELGEPNLGLDLAGGSHESIPGHDPHAEFDESLGLKEHIGLHEETDSVTNPQMADIGISWDPDNPTFESEEAAPEKVSDLEWKEEEFSLDFDDNQLEPFVDNKSQEIIREERPETDEIELKLDDLKVNETGELEIATIAEALTLPVDQTEPEESDLELGPSKDPDDISIKKAEADLSGDVREIADISLDDFQDDEDLPLNETLEVTELSFDQSPDEEEEKIDFQEGDTIDLEDISGELENGDIALDLENMDLELDIEGSEKK